MSFTLLSGMRDNAIITLAIKAFDVELLKIYHNIHNCFRHTANHLVKKAYNSIEDFQAISQNFGHKHLGTIFSAYGKLPAYQVKDVISGLAVSGV